MKSFFTTLTDQFKKISCTGEQIGIYFFLPVFSCSAHILENLETLFFQLVKSKHKSFCRVCLLKIAHSLAELSPTRIKQGALYVCEPLALPHPLLFALFGLEHWSSCGNCPCAILQSRYYSSVPDHVCSCSLSLCFPCSSAQGKMWVSASQ